MSAFDKYITPDGMGFLDSEGCSHDSKADYFHCGFLNFCGCGNPGLSDLFLLSVLEGIEDKKTGSWERLKTIFGGENGTMFFVYYVLEVLGLTEHGGCVPGWLSDKGRDALEMLREIREDLEAEDEE